MFDSSSVSRIEVDFSWRSETAARHRQISGLKSAINYQILKVIMLYICVEFVYILFADGARVAIWSVALRTSLLLPRQSLVRKSRADARHTVQNAQRDC